MTPAEPGNAKSRFLARCVGLPAVLLALLSGCPPRSAAGGELFVKRVVDGDTLLLSDGRRVRLIGVDTPEVHESKKLRRDAARTKRDIRTIRELGMRASAFVKRLVEGRGVELEYDPVNRQNDHKDKYGRTLAYVYFTCDDLPPEYREYLEKTGKTAKRPPVRLMLNRVLLQSGYANVYTRFPFKEQESFRRFEREARLAETGLWGPIDGLRQAGEDPPPMIARMRIKK
jgi:micrococcal nuclease